MFNIAFRLIAFGSVREKRRTRQTNPTVRWYCPMFCHKLIFVESKMSRLDTNNFVEGSSNFDHEKSKFHLKAQSLYKAKHTQSHDLPQSVAGKAIQST